MVDCHKSVLTAKPAVALLRTCSKDIQLKIGSGSRDLGCLWNRRMRSHRSASEWRPIEGAPLDEDVEVFVFDRCGSFYGLRDACRRTPQGWVSADGGKPLKVTPLWWRPWE